MGEGALRMRTDERLAVDDVEHMMLFHLESYVSESHRARPHAFQREIQSIIEPYGFPIRVERSGYFDTENCALLKSLELHCTERQDGESCHFRITIAGTVEKEGDARAAATARWTKMGTHAQAIGL